MADRPSSSPQSHDDEAMAQTQMMASAFRNPMIPKLYGNMMVIGQSASDVSIIVATNGNPNAVLSMSFITAKSLIADLASAIENIEKASGSSIPTIQELAPKMQEFMDLSKNVKI